MERGEMFLLNYLKHTPSKEEPSHAGANMRIKQHTDAERLADTTIYNIPCFTIEVTMENNT